jgi:hypothetical protein
MKRVRQYLVLAESQHYELARSSRRCPRATATFATSASEMVPALRAVAPQLRWGGLRLAQFQL